MIRNTTTRRGIALAISLMLAISMIAGAAAYSNYDDWHSVDDKDLEIVGPTNVTVDVSTVEDADLDGDPVEIVAEIHDADGDAIENESVELESDESDTIEFDYVSFDADHIDVYVEHEDDEGYIDQTDITVEEDRAGEEVVEDEDVEITNDTEEVYADLELDESMDVTIDLLDNESETVAFETDTFDSGNTTITLDLVDDHDIEEGNYTVEVLVDAADADDIEVHDIDTIEASTGIGAITGDVDTTLAAGIAALLIGGGIYARRQDWL